MKTKIIALILMAAMLLAVAACGDSVEKADTSKDREGNPIVLPDSMDKIISIGPSNTEVLVALGLADKIIAVDEWSGNIPGIKSDMTMLPSITEIDNEYVIDLEPDIIIVTGMSKVGGTNPLQVVEDSGICVIVIPSSTSIEEIKGDIRFVAAITGTVSKGEELVKSMEKDIADIKKIGDGINDKKTVYFEISAAPYMYSFGTGVFLNEIIEMIGAKNILASEESWISVADEQVLDANPDVILTSVNYIDDPVGEIKARDGWGVIAAVQNDAVYYIDTDASNRPSHNVVKAIKEIAKAVYPDKYN
ncbi:MAG: ABC transporter substrate-binding protein [Oscillospiraceae bacterium]|nr:ABC transporter substrate-binding protein [Oscillospiraceae bacterium]